MKEHSTIERPMLVGKVAQRLRLSPGRVGRRQLPAVRTASGVRMYDGTVVKAFA